MDQKTKISLELAGKILTLETGELAKLATTSVLARLGDTMVLVTVVEGKERTDIDYFPLTVEYVERLYAGGRIKGSRWVKREGRPSDDSILTARLIDRSIRPLFPKEFKKEVQIIVTVLSVDGENSPDVLSIIATSAALTISRIPWKGPVGAVRIGYVKEKNAKDGGQEFLINHGAQESELSDLDLVVTQLKDKTLMIEAGALQVSEEISLEAIKRAQIENNKIIDFIENFAKKIGAKKETVSKDSEFEKLLTKLDKSYKDEIVALVKNRVKKESGGDSSELIDQIIEQEKISDPEFSIDKKLVAKAVELILFKYIRENTLSKGKRPDGRKPDEIRPISGMVSVLPRTHGSAIFQRGDTQALTVVTLGSPRLEQLIESAEGEESKRYIHHYSMPPYSVGETGRIGVPSRREIGHGALAERALWAVIPKQEKFPYTIRVVSEILSSNGSTSMASTCGSTLALMDAGVPILKPVAGIAMGMVSDGDKYAILTDILGLEDFSGDMDFKVAGTDMGITAIQLDVKILGLTLPQIKEVFEKAKEARLFILKKMQGVITESRKDVSTFAPKIEQIQVPIDKIGEVIGPGGRVIKNIIAQTGATVDVEDSGLVTISGSSVETVSKALEWVKSITREITVGESFEGEVKRILPFGAFIEFLPGKEGMVHVSKMSTGFVKNPSDIVTIGQKVNVRVVEVDEQGRINLSMLPEDESSPNQRPQQPHMLQRNRGGEERSDHPLTRQFRRERNVNFDRSRRPFQGSQSSRFRKTHY